MNDELIATINSSTYLAPEDRDFLVRILPKLDRLETLKLQQNLAAEEAPVLLKQLADIKTKYDIRQQQKQQKTQDPFSKIVEKFVPKKERKPVSYSIFSKPNALGSKPPVAVKSDVPQPNSISEITDPAQLRYLNPSMLDELDRENFEQKFSDFTNSLSNMFTRIEDVSIRRNYFLTYMQSGLFSAYVSTGLTAMKHEELKPRKISINLLYQIDNKYLNSRQFRTTAMLTSHLKTLCVL